MERKEENNMCADTLHLFLIIEDNVLVDFGHQGNISMTGRGSVSFLHDVLCGMDIDAIEKLSFDIFTQNDITTTEKRKHTLALPLVAMINAIKTYKQKNDFLTIEQFLS